MTKVVLFVWRLFIPIPFLCWFHNNKPIIIDYLFEFSFINQVNQLSCNKSSAAYNFIIQIQFLINRVKLHTSQNPSFYALNFRTSFNLSAYKCNTNKHPANINTHKIGRICIQNLGINVLLRSGRMLWFRAFE